MDIKIGLIDLEHFNKTKKIAYEYFIIGPANVEDAIEHEDDSPWMSWYHEELEIVRDLMLAGF